MPRKVNFYLQKRLLAGARLLIAAPMVHALLIAVYYLVSEALVYFLAGHYIYLTASPLVIVTHFTSILLLFVVAERHAMRRSRVFLITLGAVAFIGSLVEYAVARSRYVEKFDADYFQLPANHDGILTLAAFALLARVLVAAILLFTLRHLPSGHFDRRRH